MCVRFCNNRDVSGMRKTQRTDIALLVFKAKIELPSEYLDLLRFSNGGEGPLTLPPLYFQLYGVQECIDLCLNQEIRDRFPTLVFFGSNGGLESIAFDLRTGPPWRIVMVDEIAGAESAEEIAPNMEVFIRAIGVEAESQLA